jgi:GNAT superfamily N-acetyltransferase
MVPEAALPDVTAGPGTVPVVRRATEADVAPMAAQLARSFFDDPIIVHLFRNEARRLEALRRFFTLQMRKDYLAFGGCYTTEGYSGSAIWAPAGKPMQTVAAGVLSMAALLPYVARNMVTTIRVLSFLESIHPHEPHWYLAILGADPSSQGKGVGTSLMRPVLEHCDRLGLPAYLESSKERNLPFYSRHGFTVTKEVALPGGGPTIWPMWRDPRPPV